MKRRGLNTIFLVGCAGAAGGCGAIPDFLVEAARTSAEEALRETVDGVIDTVFEESLSGLLDFSGLEPEFIPEEDGGSDEGPEETFDFARR